jgi:hypothetical protein
MLQSLFNDAVSSSVYKWNDRAINSLNDEMDIMWTAEDCHLTGWKGLQKPRKTCSPTFKPVTSIQVIMLPHLIEIL